VARYAGRWSVEVAIETAKGPMGVGQARNHLEQAVQRTVPFGMLTMSLVVIWYGLHGHHPDDVTDRRARQPWSTTKTEPSLICGPLCGRIQVVRATPSASREDRVTRRGGFADACASDGRAAAAGASRLPPESWDRGALWPGP